MVAQKPTTAFKPAGPGYRPNAGRGPAFVPKYQAEADRLRRRPWEWIVVIVASTPKRATSHVGDIHRGRKLAFLPVGNWHASSRGCQVLIRYVGTPQQETA